MKNILVTGSYSVGKTSVVESLEKQIPHSERIVTYDVARHFLRTNNLKSNNLSEKQKIELQTNVIAGYIGSLIQVEHAKVMGVLDGSLIESYAYSLNILPEYILEKVRMRLAAYPEHSVAYVLPPTIPLEDDGLRHTNKEFRVHIHSLIMQIIKTFNIPHHIVTAQSVEGRVKEIKAYHKLHV